MVVSLYNFKKYVIAIFSMIEISLLSRLTYSLCSTGITIPTLIETQSLNDELDNDGKINQNEIMNNY